MFIYTIQDVIGLVLMVALGVIVLTYYILAKISDWKRRRKKSENSR